MRAQRRDLRVYLASHPVLFTVLTAARHLGVRRLGTTVLMHAEAEVREVLTRVPLDRLAAGTIGAAAREVMVVGILFDQEGQEHRGARRALVEDLGSAGVGRLRPVWTEVLRRRVEPLGRGASVDVVDLVREMAGATLGALLRVRVEPRAVARAAHELAAAGVREHASPLRTPRGARAAARRTANATATLSALLHEAPLAAEPAGASLAAMLAVAAVNTTVAGIPRAVAWCADARLWTQAADVDARPTLADELLRVVAPVPILSRVAAGAAEVGGCPVRRGDRLLLVTRDAVRASPDGPDCARPAPPEVAQLVFGVGPHTCPGARLARAQLIDTLAALAPHAPVVLRAKADHGAALPGWASLLVAPGRGR